MSSPLMNCGCSPARVTIVPEGEPVQLAEDVKAYVYVETAESGKIVRSKSANRVVLHEGQWVATIPAKK